MDMLLEKSLLSHRHSLLDDVVSIVSICLHNFYVCLYKNE